MRPKFGQSGQSYVPVTTVLLSQSKRSELSTLNSRFTLPVLFGPGADKLNLEPKSAFPAIKVPLPLKELLPPDSDEVTVILVAELKVLGIAAVELIASLSKPSVPKFVVSSIGKKRLLLKGMGLTLR
ncbi:MAG: hypothetical protein ACJAS1_003736 [Oleiphilaceae bacterium]|jgi:hypothetical protein